MIKLVYGKDKAWISNREEARYELDVGEEKGNIERQKDPGQESRRRGIL